MQVRRRLIEAARAVFDAFVAAKQLGLQALLSNRDSGLFWYWEALEEQLRVSAALARVGGEMIALVATRVLSFFFSAFGKKGPLFIMNMMTDGKCRLSFEVAAQNQMQHQLSFAPEIQRSFSAAKARQTSSTK